MTIRRRDLLTGTAVVLVGGTLAHAEVVSGKLPWHPDAGEPPQPVEPGGWKFFTPAEAAAVEAAVDRLIPPDRETPGGKDAGCAVFLDRQLAGAYGRAQGLYNQPPFLKGSKSQGPQSEQTPAQAYRAALAALDRYCRSSQDGGQPFAQLDGAQQDRILKGLEDGSAHLEGVDGKTFFEHLLTDTQQGFFADPIYGGNRDMCAWKMIGFPGARYDYRDWVNRHNERYPHPPVSIAGAPEWKPT
ncbi:MAG: gluconate 2-dehydrogenase subunit 3 family protein [Steroidobacteraceae bacterium]